MPLPSHQYCDYTYIKYITDHHLLAISLHCNVMCYIYQDLSRPTSLMPIFIYPGTFTHGRTFHTQHDIDTPLIDQQSPVH